MSQAQLGFIGRVDQRWRRVAFTAIAALAVVLVFGDASPRAAGNFTPTITFETSTTRATSHPDVRITVDNTSSSEDLRDLTIDLPKGFLGSLDAAEQCSVTDTNNVACSDDSLVGTVTNDATVDNSDVRLRGKIFLTEPLNSTDPAGLQIVVPAVIGGVNMGDVVVNARAELKYGTLPGGFPAGAQGPIEGIRTIVTDVPRSITDDNARTVEFTLKRLIVDLRSDQQAPYSKLFTNPSVCSTTQLTGTAESYDDSTEPLNESYTVDGCSTVSYADPAVTFTPTTNAANSLIGFTSEIAFADNQASSRRVNFRTSPGIAANLPAFGSTADQCPAASANSNGSNNAFDPSACPTQAKIGSVEIETPLLPEPLEGDVYSVGSSLPRIAIYVDETTGPNNPQGVEIGLLGVTSTPTLVAPCDGDANLSASCPLVYQIQFNGLPDAPIKKIALTIDGPDRTGDGAVTLSGKILRTVQASDPACKANDDIVAEFTSHASASTTAAGLDEMTITGCTAQSVTMTGAPYGGTATSSTPDLPFTTAEPTTYCAVDQQVPAWFDDPSEIDPYLCDSPFAPASPLAKGLHRLFVFGQEESWRSFIVPSSTTPDTTAPISEIDSGPSGVTSDTTPEWTFSADESSAFQCSVDDGAFLPCESGASPSTSGSFEISDALYAGTDHKFAVRAQDAAGNIGAPVETVIEVEVAFAPSIQTNLTTTQARAHPDLDVTIATLSNEDMKSVKLALPSGFFGGLTGVQGLCPVATAAAGNCTDASQVGTVETEALVDESLVRIDGQVYLTESAHAGEPAGLSIKVPAVIQDIDLGDIIVAGRLQVRGQAEGIDSLVVEIPKDIDPALSGNTFDTLTEFDMREITLKLRTGAGATHPLLTNPSSCNGSAFVASFTGYASTLASDSNPFAATGCEALGFSPNLAISLTDSTTGGPPGVGEFVSSKVYTNLSATLTANPGESGLKDASILMPKPVTIDPQQIPTPCSVAEYAGGAGQCPAYATIGNASAISPLLPEPLTGTVYLLKNADPRQALPGLLIALRGRINIDIIAYNRFENGSQIRTMLSSLPDVPLSSFTLNVNRLITTRPEACTVPADEWGVTGNLTAFNGKPAPVTQQLAFNCSPKYTFSYRKKAKKTTFGVTATGGPVRIKNLEVKLPKYVTSITKVTKSKKLMKKRLIVKTDGKRLSTKCFKLYKTKLKVTLPCGKVKFASVISASFRAGLLDAGRRAPASKKLKKLTVSGRSTTNARIKFTK